MRAAALPLLLALIAVVALVLLPPPALAQGGDEARILVDEVEGPDEIMPGKEFALTARLRNVGDADASPALSAAIYRQEDGVACGPQSDERFGGFINRANVLVSVPAGSTRDYPPEGAGEPWRMHVDPSRVREAGRYEICVFAMKSQTPIDYYDYHTWNVTVRVANTAPVADFSWTPQVGNVTTEFRFWAEGEDLDGDPVSFAWDFGYDGAKGRARANGPEAGQRFFTFSAEPRTYTVTLTASDAFDATLVTKEITVFPADVEAEPVVRETPGGTGDGFLGLPGAPTWGVVAALGALAWGLRGRPIRRS